MKILSIRDGGIVYEGPFQTIKRTAEQAVKGGTALSYADLRKADLSHGQLDGAVLGGSCLWGADLSHAELSGVYMHGCDGRLMNFDGACLAESAFSACDFRGAHFAGAVFTETSFAGCKFSCPSFLRQDFSGVREIKDSIYYHLGETECPVNAVPVRMTGLEQEIILLDRHIIAAGQVYAIEAYDGPLLSLVHGLADLKPAARGMLTVC